MASFIVVSWLLCICKLLFWLVSEPEASLLCVFHCWTHECQPSQQTSRVLGIQGVPTQHHLVSVALAVLPSKTVIPKEPYTQCPGAVLVSMNRQHWSHNVQVAVLHHYKECKVDHRGHYIVPCTYTSMYQVCDIGGHGCVSIKLWASTYLLHVCWSGVLIKL